MVSSFFPKSNKHIAPIPIENTRKYRNRRAIPQNNKQHIFKIISKYYLQRDELQAFPVSSEVKQGCPLSPLLFNILLETLAVAIREEKEIESVEIVFIYLFRMFPPSPLVTLFMFLLSPLTLLPLP